MLLILVEVMYQHVGLLVTAAATMFVLGDLSNLLLESRCCWDCWVRQ
jgi:hypothetical protein